MIEGTSAGLLALSGGGFGTAFAIGTGLIKMWMDARKEDPNETRAQIEARRETMSELRLAATECRREREDLKLALALMTAKANAMRKIARIVRHELVNKMQALNDRRSVSDIPSVDSIVSDIEWNTFEPEDPSSKSNG